MINTSLGSLVQLSTLLLANIKSNEQRLLGPACETNLPPEVRIVSGRLQQWRRKISSLVLHVRGKIHIGTLMPLCLAWCLHEVRHGRRRFIAVVCRVASFVSTVRLTTCRKEPNCFDESCLLKDPSETTVRWSIQRTSSVRCVIINTCVGSGAMHDGIYQKAHVASYL